MSEGLLYALDHHKRFREVRVRDAASRKRRYFVHPETPSPQVAVANHHCLPYSTATVRSAAVYSTEPMVVAWLLANLYYVLSPMFDLSLPVARVDQREAEGVSLAQQRELQRSERGEYVGLGQYCLVRQCIVAVFLQLEA